jgi:arylsulfatase
VDNKLRYVHNYLGIEYYTVGSEVELPGGEHTLAFEFEKTGDPDLFQGKGVPGTVRLFVDGEKVDEGELPTTVPLLYGLGSG